MSTSNLLLLCLLSFATSAAAGTPSHPDAWEEPAADTAAAPADTAGEKKASEPTWFVAETHGPADTVSFPVDEGTWISVDVAPDGKTLAFDLLGDLYLLPMEGGAARRLTSGPAYDMQPRFSPDGKRLLFTSDRDGGDNLWTIAADGTDPKPVTSDKTRQINSGDWSPDGEYVVGRKRLTDASSIGTVELWVYHLMGGTGVGITKKSDIPDANGPIFSPDGRWIYFAARNARYAYNRNVYQGIWQIQGYDRKTGNFRPLTDGYGGSARPRISPDGKTLSFVRRDRSRTLLVLHDIASGRERVLFDGLDRDMQENFAWTGSYPGYDWTPDGKSLVITYGGGIHRIDVASGATRPIPFSAGVEQTVARALRYPVNIAPDRVRIRMLSWPSYSPDGKALVFSTLGRIYRMDVPGGAPAPLQVEGPRSYAPTFSPSGRELAYVSWSDAEGGQIWIGDAQGRRSRRVTRDAGQYANPAFSGDGQKLAFLRGSGATQRGRDLSDELQLDLFWTPVRGGEPQYVVSLANRGASRRMPRLSWSPDATRIFYFEESGSGEAERTVLLSIRPDGTDRQEHLKVRHAEEIVVSPDARWAAFTTDFDGYLAALPSLGREPIEIAGEGGPVPVHRFSREGADWLSWTADGKSLTWGQGPFLYRLSLEDLRRSWETSKHEAGEKTDPVLAAAAKAKEKDKEKDKAKSEAAKVHPDTLEVKLFVPRHVPSGTVAFRGARLVTMKGEEIVDRGTLVVEGDRIVALGPEASTSVPAGARVIDAAGKTIIPGLVDVHAHLHYNSLDIIPESVDAYYANLAYGVTTTHDPSASNYTVFTQSEMVEAGVTTGPRIFSTGWILYGADLPGKTDVGSLDDAKRHVRRMKRLGAFSVKSYMQPRRDQRQWILAAAREESIMVVPEGGGNLEMNLSMVLDGHTGIEHALPVTPLYDDVVTLFARSETGYTPTLLVAYGGLSGEHWFYQHDDVWKNPKLQRFIPRGWLDARARRREVMAPDDDWHHIEVAESANRILQAGGRVQLGGHGQLQGLGPHWELWGLCQGGMPTKDALRAATLLGAEYIGLDRWIGSLEPGKLADFVVLDRNPLEDIRNSTSVRWVVKNGEVFDGETMAKLWPEERPCPVFPWQAQGEMLSRTGGDLPGR